MPPLAQQHTHNNRVHSFKEKVQEEIILLSDKLNFTQKIALNLPKKIKRIETKDALI